MQQQLPDSIPLEVPVLTVSQFTQAIRFSLESTFPTVWLQGEISNFKEQASGHLYFSLKDSQSQISAVMFRQDAGKLRMPIKGGDHVVVRAELTVYPPRGNYQVIVRELSHMGIGDLLIKFEKLKQKLQEKGFFAKERKKPLPVFPKKIGVITSPTGAVIQDIIHILTRRYPGFQLLLNPVKVQGEGAAQEIAKAIDDFNRHQLVDVMIVGRGGGSIEDLFAFNEEIVAEAIFRSQIPVISAVGHETDYCISDFVADVRAPTPSAAAELVIAEKSSYLKNLNHLGLRIQQTLYHHVHRNKEKLQGLSRQPAFSSPDHWLGNFSQHLDHIKIEIEESLQQKLYNLKLRMSAYQREANALKPSSRIAHYQLSFQNFSLLLKRSLSQKFSILKKDLTLKSSKLDSLAFHQLNYLKNCFPQETLYKRLDQSILFDLRRRKDKISQLLYSLESKDPSTLLKKGYSILFSEKDGSVISSVKSLASQGAIKVLMADGEAIITLKQIQIL